MTSTAITIVHYSQYILDWVEGELNKQPRLDDLALQLGYSKRMIQLHFKKTYGITIGDYILNRRLYRASLLLRLTELPVGEISYHLHFDSHNNFCRAFKRKFHCSPLVFRRLPVDSLPSLQLPQIHYNGHIDYKSVTLNNKILSGVSFQYEDNFYQPNTWGMNVKIQRLRSWFQDCRAPFAIASKVTPSDSTLLQARAGGIAVSAIAGRVIEAPTTVTGDESYPLNGQYLCCTFHGFFSDYTDYIKSIYMHLIPKLKLTHRDARVVEFFYFTRHLFDNDPKVFCECYIPVSDCDSDNVDIV